MRFSQLRYFVAACRCGSLTKAAAEFQISQPALSKAVKALEEELEVEQMCIRDRASLRAGGWIREAMLSRNSSTPVSFSAEPK